MPLWKFRSLEDAERHLDSLSTTPEASLGSALTLLALAEGVRRQVRTTQRGVVLYRSLAEGEADRERFATARLRAADAEAAAAIDSTMNARTGNVRQ